MAEDDDLPVEAPGVRTREKNKNAHPGLRAMQELGESKQRKRRTPAQVKADKEAAAAKVAVEAAEQEERVSKIARIEADWEVAKASADSVCSFSLSQYQILTDSAP